jgi:peptide deformylase
MIRPLLRHGAAALHQRADPVAAITNDIQQIIDDMVETMHRAPGIGLAAPQIGVSKRIVVVDLSIGARPSELIVLVNPRLTDREGLQLEDEGCLSLPGFTATVPRPRRVVAQGMDRGGGIRTVEGTGLLARALQHEVDHLDGRLYVDRLGPARRWAVLRRVHALQAHGRW